MSVETVLENLVAQEALRERTSISEASQIESKTIIDQAEQKAKAIIEQKSFVFEQRAALAKAQILYQAKFESQIEDSQARQVIFESLLEKVTQKLKQAYQEKGYNQLLRELLEEALEKIDRKAIVYVRKEDVKTVQEILTQRGRGAMKVVGDQIEWGGICLQSEDGGMKLDNSLESRFKKALEVYKEIIGKDLFK